MHPPSHSGVHEITCNYIDLRQINGQEPTDDAPDNPTFQKVNSDNSEAEFLPVSPDDAIARPADAGGIGGGDGDGGASGSDVIRTELGLALGRTKRTTLMNKLGDLDKDASVMMQVSEAGDD